MSLPCLPLEASCSRFAHNLLSFEVGFHRVSPFMNRSQTYQQIERLYDNRSSSGSDLQRKNDLYQLFMLFAVSLPYSKRISSSKSPIHYYASAMQYAEEVLSHTDGDTQIQNTMLLLVFAHQHATGSEYQISNSLENNFFFDIRPLSSW